MEGPLYNITTHYLGYPKCLSEVKKDRWAKVSSQASDFVQKLLVVDPDAGPFFGRNARFRV